MKIETIDVKDEYRDIVQANLDNCLTKTNVDYPLEYQGKVRDRIDMGKYYALITTDRQSAFDRILASIPFKGQVLNETAAWWFQKTDHIIKNHIIDVPHPNVTIAEKANPFPIEFVVRGYVTGSSNTSLWTHYQNGVREYCGIALPEGLKKNSNLIRQSLLQQPRKKIMTVQFHLKKSSMRDGCRKNIGRKHPKKH